MKRVINKFIILFLVFIAVISIMFFRFNRKIENESITMGKASLPTISVKNDDSYINMLYGYTVSMEEKYMRDSVSPLSDNGKLDITVNNCENLVVDVSYSILKTDGTPVVSDKKIQPSDSNVETTQVTIDAGADVTPDTEYMLVVKLTTDKYDEIYYYTRIIRVSEPHYLEQQKFVYNFSEKTLDKTAAEELVSYIEPSDSEENSNLGKVTIYSSFDQLTWGNLSPERVTQPEITYKELLGDVGSYELTYRVKALNDYNTEQYYDITEFFRVKWTETEIYLLDYERTMEQVFDAMGQSVTSSRINVGIGSSLQADYAVSKEGNYVAFEKENALWLMDTENNEITSVFTFASSVSDIDVRNTNNEHNMKIISVNKNGNVEFLVYGYMNRGEHEGNVGVALYNYSKESNVVRETVFIPFTRSYGILRETIGKLLYVNDSNVMYIMLNDCIYSIDLTGNEYVEIISGLKDGCYAINNDGNVIAWEKDMSYAGSDSIVIMNLETNEESTINAEAGMKVKVEGFVGDDIAYGIAEASRIVTDQNGMTTVPMHILKIVNMKGEEQKSYSQEGYYFTSSQVKDNMINLKRVQYDPTGTVLQNTTDYQIFGNSEEEEDAATEGVINTELKQKEVVINFTRKITTSDKLVVKYPKEIKFDTTNTLSLRDLISSDNRYYVYGRGVISDITDNAADAVVAANDVNGVVIDDEGRYIWARRSRKQQAMLTNVGMTPAADVSGYVTACVNSILQSEGVNADVSAEIAAGKSTIEVINSHLTNGKALDLSGCSLDEMLYYVDRGYPVLGMLDNGNCVLVVGFDFYNAVLLNPGTGEVYKQGLEETTGQFAQYGNRFLSIIK